MLKRSILFKKNNLPLRQIIKKRMTKSIFLFLLGILSLSAMAQPKLSEEARISLMTSAPYDEEVFTVYGHAALRIYDPKQNIDYIFNYGIFDFSKPNFIYRFAKGETDYKLGVADFQDYVIEYQMRGSDITEQVLNLTQEEKEHIWDALLINYRPENRVYRYNFFFDNCATRPAAILEKEINGSVDYQYPYQSQTFRDLINYCTRNHPWLTFGCDLALGSPTDREATQHEMLFLPPYLKEAFSKATITGRDNPPIGERDPRDRSRGSRRAGKRYLGFIHPFSLRLASVRNRFRAYLDRMAQKKILPVGGLCPFLSSRSRRCHPLLS